MGSAMWNEDGGIVWMLPPMNDSFLKRCAATRWIDFRRLYKKIEEPTFGA